MSRLNEWLDTKREQRSDYASVILDDPAQIEVWRIPASGIAPGFVDDVPSPEFHKRITARIDKQTGGGHSKVSGEAGKSVRYDLMATTLDKDVRETDIWVYLGKHYQVDSIDSTDDIRVEVYLTRFRDESVD
jgi:hypothetical protein